MKNLLLVGCGSMGGALLHRWSQTHDFETLTVICPRESSVSPITQDPRVQWTASPPSLPCSMDCIIFAIKPQKLASLLPLYKSFVSPSTIFITVAAGKTFAFYQRYLGEQALIVRAMPNTPCALGEGITLATSIFPLSDSHHRSLQYLLECLGYVQWFEDEKMLDICTVLTGCGPAYIFQFIESLTAAAVSRGLNPSMVETLVPLLIQGSISYLKANHRSAADLRAEVTSPQGVTAAALSILRNSSDGLEILLKKTFQAAIERSQAMRSLDD